MLGVFAEFERSIIQERVRAGLRRARSEGKQLGRPPLSPELQERIRKALNAPGRTEGVRVIAKRFGVGPGTVQRISTSPFEHSKPRRGWQRGPGLLHVAYPRAFGRYATLTQM
jgi:DNA invertase Pin-like site-specific DNA recombinase